MDYAVVGVVCFAAGFACAIVVLLWASWENDRSSRP